jgi:hypothetical protein
MVKLLDINNLVDKHVACQRKEFMLKPNEKKQAPGMVSLERQGVVSLLRHKT